MGLSKLMAAAFMLFCGFTCNTQTKKSADNCQDECCKDDKPAKTSLQPNQTSSMNPALKNKTIACKLTSPELQKRKEQVIASLKAKVLNRQELKDGYNYHFKATDEIFDEVTSFIKTERQCCDFFTFNLSISDENIWLTITGPEGAKEFIEMEMGF
ncbi:MAG TPA: hypothetical protein VGQ09_12255 [Chitinophagaceae bacterium]|jgi:hypothetical protein|nr:hypothetical protein [Chitinophagaceae bacterium]